MGVQIIGWLLFLLQIGAFVLGAVALVHAIRQRPDAFTAVGKLTKPTWLGIIGASMLAILLFGVVMGPLSILGILGVVAIGVYMADVKPKVDEVQRPNHW